MASRKSGKAQLKAAPTTNGDAMEAKVVALAEQLGWFLGTVRGKADGWLHSPKVRDEVTRIRDGAAELMDQVNRASASARKTATGATNTAIDAAATATTSARKVATKVAAHVSTTASKAVATASTAASRAAGKTAKPAAAKAATAAKPSRGLVDAPGKRHRKPPPQMKVDKRMGEPAGKKAGQKQFQPGHGARRG